MMQTHPVLEDYQYNPNHTGHGGIYAKPVYNLSRLCSQGQISPPEKMSPQDGMMSHPSSGLHAQAMYSNHCHNSSSYRYTSLTIPVMPPKKFRTEQAEILRCKRRVDLSHKLGYKTHPTAVARRNERERNRVKHINSTFATLRQHIPCAAKNKKMSKVETLRSAIKYINHLQHILDSQTSQTKTDVDDEEESSMLGHLHHREDILPSTTSINSPGELDSSCEDQSTSFREHTHPGSAAILSPPATPESDHTCSTPGSDDPRGSGYYGNVLEEEEEDEEEVGGLSHFADWF